MPRKNAEPVVSIVDVRFELPNSAVFRPLYNEPYSGALIVYKSQTAKPARANL